MRGIWFFMVLLTGCASSKDVVTTDGTIQKVITCSRLGFCHEKARDLCGNYQVIKTDSKEGPHNSEEINLHIKCTQ